MAENNENIKYALIGVGGILVLALAYFGIIKPITNKLGLTKDKDDRDNKSLVSISSAKANTLATNMHDGKGTFWDDEDMGVGAITSAGSKVNISYVANQFNVLFGKSMESYMDYLEPEDWTNIDDYISKIKKS